MKRSVLLAFICFSVALAAQTKQGPAALTSDKALRLTPFGGLRPATTFAIVSDSLNGFDEKGLENDLLSRGLNASERFNHLEFQKRSFIKTKYGLVNTTAQVTGSAGKNMGGSAGVFGPPCVNEGFESTAVGAYTSATAVSGWTVTSGTAYTCITSSSSWSQGSNEFSIVATPILNVPNVGTIGHSPFGGTVVAQLNNHTANYSITRISQNFPVTSSNSLFQYAFAGYYEDGGTGHGCCEQPGFNVLVKNCSGSILPCVSHTWNVPSTGCNMSSNTYSFNSSTGVYYTNWQIKQIDLTPYVGSCVTIEVYSYDCAFGGHKGVTYFDSYCNYQLFSGVGTPINSPSPINFCPGGPAQIIAPVGYSSYLWTLPNGSTVVPNPPGVLTITNPIVASVYTVNLTTASGCMYTMTTSLAHSQVSLVALSSVGTCSAGASGATTVFPTGSGSGYNYVWTNSSNSVVSTASVASNLAAGVYSVQISAANNSSCGIAGGTIAVSNNIVNTYNVVKPYCSGSAYMAPGAGTNYKWYSNFTPISGTAGTAPSYTVTSPTNGSIYRVAFTSAQGCRDSVIYTLQANLSPSLSVTYNQLTCQGSNNGVAAFSFNSSYSNAGTNSYSVFSTASTPSYISTNTLTSLNAYTATGLAGAGTYSVLAFDGSCYSSTSFSVNTFYTTNLYSLTVIGATAICQGNTMPVGVAFTNTSNTTSQFTYTWMPNQFLSGNNPNFPNTLITPTTGAGTSATLVYTVAISPTTAVCAITRTFAIQVSNPGTPAISSPGTLCNNATPLTLTASPSGGVFGGNGAVSPGGILNPSQASLGMNTFSYLTSVNGCSASTTGTFNVITAPLLSVTGNTSICAGQSTTLTASGAQVYFWPGLGISQQVVVSPASTTSYVVTGSSGNMCTDSKMVIVNVTQIPNITFSGNMNVCTGDSTTLGASGANSFVWSTGGTGTTESFYPSGTTTYSITGTNNPAGCTNNATFTITVNPLPVITVQGPTLVCKGDPVMLFASGAGAYVWDFIPANFYTNILNSSRTITVTGTDQNGCKGTTYYSISVDDCTGLESNASTGKIAMYPNPAHNKVIMLLPGDGELTIYDAAGKLILVKERKAGNFNLDVSGFSAGVYLVKFESGTNTCTARLIKEN